MPNNLEKPTTSEIELPDDLVHVEGATFQMGSDNGFDSEKPVHEVTISDFYISQYPITVKQYRLFCDETGKPMPKKPSWGWRDNHPIVNVSWEEAKAYCEWKNGRLPTEAEWEFSAIGGKKKRVYEYSGSNQAKDVAWYEKNARSQTYMVGKKTANELNMFDMSGNVWEWCMDRYASYNGEPQNNPQGPTEGNERVLRGGSWNCGDYRLRLTVRRGIYPKYKHSDVGFRLVKSKEVVRTLMLEKQIAELEKQLELLNQQHYDFKNKIIAELDGQRDEPTSMLEKQIAELEKQWELFNQKHYDLKTQIAELEKQHDGELISRLETQIAELEKQLALINQHHSDLKPKIAELKNPFYGELTSRLEKQIAELEKQLERLNQQHDELKTQLAELKKPHEGELISRLETQIAELEKPLELLNQQHSDLTNKIAELLASKLTKQLAELEKHWKLLNQKLYHLEL